MITPLVWRLVYAIGGTGLLSIGSFVTGIFTGNSFAFALGIGSLWMYLLLILTLIGVICVGAVKRKPARARL